MDLVPPQEVCVAKPTPSIHHPFLRQNESCDSLRSESVIEFELEMSDHLLLEFTTLGVPYVGKCRTRLLLTTPDFYIATAISDLHNSHPLCVSTSCQGIR